MIEDDEWVKEARPVHCGPARRSEEELEAIGVGPLTQVELFVPKVGGPEAVRGTFGPITGDRGCMRWRRMGSLYRQRVLGVGFGALPYLVIIFNYIWIYYSIYNYYCTKLTL
jgi:hypothetical protein